MGGIFFQDEYSKRVDLALAELPNEVLVNVFKLGVKDAVTLKALKLTSRRFYKLIIAAKINCIQIENLYFNLEHKSQQGIKISYRKKGSKGSKRRQRYKYWNPESADNRLAALMQHMTVSGTVKFSEWTYRSLQRGHLTTSALFHELLASPMKFHETTHLIFGSKYRWEFDINDLNPRPGSVSRRDLLAFIHKVNPNSVRVSFVHISPTFYSLAPPPKKKQKPSHRGAGDP